MAWDLDVQTLRSAGRARAEAVASNGAAASGGGNSKNKIVKTTKEELVKAEYYAEKPATPLLDTVNHPVHTKNLSTPVSDQLPASKLSTLPYWLGIERTSVSGPDRPGSK